jgi:hypothetical protein
MAGRSALLFLTDHNVPDSLGHFLAEVGHDIARVRDVMAADSPDPIVAEAAIRAGRVLISWDRDFNQQRFLRPWFATLSRIGFSCPEPDGVARMRSVLDLVEFVFHRAQGSPLTIRIGRDKFQVSC